MEKNTIINRRATQKIATALGELNDQVVYVGGAMVSLYIDDPAAEDVRPTKDLDLTFEIASESELEKLRLTLQNKGFVQSHEDDVICRFRYEDMKIDVMSTQEIGWAPSNRWFMPGYENSNLITLDQINIRIMPLPYFLASKFDAFWSRGIEDPILSHDFEDIIYIMNYSSNISNIILSANQDVQVFIKDSFQKVLESELLRTAMDGHLFFEHLEERREIIFNKLNEILS